MDSQTIRAALGLLQAEPHSAQAWTHLREAALAADGHQGKGEALELLRAARNAQAERGEWSLVSLLLELEGLLSPGGEHEIEIVLTQAKVQDEELFDDERALMAYRRLLELAPNHSEAQGAVAEIEGRRADRAELVRDYLREAENASDELYKSSMLMRASEMEVRGSNSSEMPAAPVDRLEQAVRLDPANERAGHLLEHLYRRASRWEELATVLERLADRSESPEACVAAGVRLARVYAHHLDDRERAARAYDRVLRKHSNQAEAKAFLSNFYTTEEHWSELVGLHERELNEKDISDAGRIGEMLQIAMLHWRKLRHPRDAEPWFERVRKLDPINEGMLSFFREYCGGLNDDARLLEVLQGAQRALPDGTREKTQLASEIGHLLEGQANAQKAIEQYKTVLRQDPEQRDARDALKRLYQQTQSYNALIELLRQQLERSPAEDYSARLGILREVAAVYRHYLRNDTALLSVLNQIVQLDQKLEQHNVAEMRELTELYDRLGRYRDLITYQLKLAEVTPDLEEKKQLYRASARRWLEQFSNVQNATEAYAALLKLSPDDGEANHRLEELYRKRRAWDKLYDLYLQQLEHAEGGQRITLLRELAQLASERLNRQEEAISLYQKILELDPSRFDVLDSLEKHTERNKNWAKLAEALERRVILSQEPAAKLAALQKLGSVYADQLGDKTAAASAWRRVLELSPGHPRALRVLRDTCLESGDYQALEDLYASQNDYEGLAEVLNNAADRSRESQARIALSYRAAHVYEQKLAQPERAFRSYERILAADAQDLGAVRALIPLYEKEEKFARLPVLYEQLYENSQEVREKVTLSAKLVEVLGVRLGDKKAAAGQARRAYKLAPDDPGTLELFENATRGAGSWDAFAETLAERIQALAGGSAASDPKSSGRKGKRRKKSERTERAPEAAEPSAERRELELKLASVYLTELSRLEDAIQVYRNLVEREPSDTEVIGILEGLLRREDRRDDLRWLFEIRVEHAADKAARLELLTTAAHLEQESFRAPERAAALFRRILELEPDHEPALRAMPRLLLEAGDAQGAVAGIQRHRDLLSGEARAEREADLAELYLHQLDDPEAALGSAIEALKAPAAAVRAMDVLERLVNLPAVRPRAARVLSQEYARNGEWRREVVALSLLLEAVVDPEERLRLYLRLIEVHEQKLAQYNSAFEVILKALPNYPSELGLWDRADALATLTGRPSDLADTVREVLHGELPRSLDMELSERAARLHEDKLGDPLGATPYLERVLRLEPGNDTAFRRLKDILTGAERWSEVIALYDLASKATEEASRRIEMLVEVALICEEIVEDPDRAIGYYERILELDPKQDVSIRALDRLYVRQEQSEKLSTLLGKRLRSASGEEVFELKLRLAKLELDMHRPENAVSHLEDVLRERWNDSHGRELAERMLTIGELRGRAAQMLENVYKARDEIPDLVRVIEIQLEELEPEQIDERRRLLQRIATLRDERLRDDAGAFEALAALVPLDPADARGRQRLLEIGRRLSSLERVAQVLELAAERIESPGLKGEILLQIAALHEDPLGHRDQAETFYRRVLRLGGPELDLVLVAARALERIYLATGNNTGLREMLQTQVEFEHHAAQRSELLGRIGELCQTALGDVMGAITAWNARLAFDPTDARSLSALDRLYEGEGEWQKLVEILERRQEMALDADERRALLQRRAEVLWHRLEQIPEAIAAYQAIMRQFGPSPESLRALEVLFARTERWSALGEVLETHLDLTDTDAERLELLGRIGDLRRERVSDVEGALEAYRKALALDVHHAPSRRALELLLDSENALVRREAAELLRPIYTAEGDNPRLLRSLEIQIDTSDDLPERLRGLEAAMRVAEGPLADPGRAFGYADRAVRTAVGHPELQMWLGDLERLAWLTGRKAEFLSLLREVVSEIFDQEMQLSVLLKIASTARKELGDLGTACEFYKRALEIRADDRTALEALETLYEEAGDAQNLLAILERRFEVIDSDAERQRLLYRRARLQAEVLKDIPRAIEAYEAILDVRFEAEASSALEALYRESQSWSDLVSLYERQLEAELGSAAELHVKIAKVSARGLSDLGRAFNELEAALRADPEETQAVEELERLLGESPSAEWRSRAAVLLEPVYLARGEFEKLVQIITARLEYSNEPEERRELLVRLSRFYEEQREDYASAFEAMARLLAEDPADESTVSELERLAKVAGSERRLAEVYAEVLSRSSPEDRATVRLSERAGELLGLLGEVDRALGFYKRALSLEPENKRLFAATDALLSRAGRHRERVAVYREALEHLFDPHQRMAALHTMAALQRRELKQPEEAIATYRAVLELEDTDPTALDALTELYTELRRWEDLSDLYLRRAETAPSLELAADYRLKLARLHVELEQYDPAIFQLEEIVQRLPAHPATIQELESLRKVPSQRQRVVDILRPLYQSLDDWPQLIALNEDRYQLASEIPDQVAVLRETAELWERRGSDLARARRALELAFRLEPDDAEVRFELERVSGLTGEWDKLAEAYERAVESSTPPASRHEILSALGKIHNTRRDDPRRALHAYAQLHALDPSSVEALEEMERLSTLLSDWSSFVRVLSAKNEIVFDDAERAQNWRRIAEAERDMLERPEVAIASYERALELEPNHAFTVDCLIALYEEQHHPTRLVDLYQHRVELAHSGELEHKFELLVKAAEVCEKELSNPTRAIELWCAAADLRPGDLEVMHALNRLYREQQRWPELLTNLEFEAERSGDAARRAELRRELGAVLADKLGQMEEAIEAYRMALKDAPEDPEAALRLCAIGRDHEELRRHMAEILVPIFENTRRYPELVEVLELRLSVESDPAERVRTLHSLAEVLETRLERPERAQTALLRALAEEPGSPEIHAKIERLAELAQGFHRYADALLERAKSTFDPELSHELWVRLGRIGEVHLKDDLRAAEAYSRAAEQTGDEPQLLDALDRLYLRLDNPRSLAEILERRVVIEPSADKQAELYYRLAELHVHSFGETERGLGLLRMALERLPEHKASRNELERLLDRPELFEEAAEILESIYRVGGAPESLAKLFERRIAAAAAPEEKSELRRSLAKVLEEECHDSSRAQQVLEEGVLEAPTDLNVLDELERLAAITRDWRGASRALNQAILTHTELLPEEASALCLRLSSWLKDRAGEPELAEQAVRRALEFEPHREEILERLEALQRERGASAELIATLRRRARLELDETRREQFYREARELAETLSDPVLAEAIVRELLSLDESNSWALSELTELRLTAADFKEALALLIRRADLEPDSAKVRSLRLRAAELSDSKMNDTGRAIELYEELLRDEPGSVEAQEALKQLYAKESQWPRLAALYERLIDFGESPADRSRLRLQLGGLWESPLGDSDRAIEQYLAVLDEEFSQNEAVERLLSIYEKLGRHSALADLLDRQIDLARSRGDLGSELEYQTRLARLYETRLESPDRAIEIYLTVIDRDVGQRQPLSALARLLQARGRLDEAAEALERLLGLSSGGEAAQVALELAALYERLGVRERAVIALERGLVADDRNTEARLQLRALYEAQGLWDKLVQMLIKDVESTSSKEEAYRILRYAAEISARKRNDHAAAAELLERATQYRPEDRELLLELSEAYRAAGRSKEAAGVLVRVVESYGAKRTKELGEIHRRLAAIYLTEGQTKEALGELDKAFRIEPGNIKVLALLGEVALEVGDFKKAQQMFRALLLQRLEDAGPIRKSVVFMRLGEIHEKLGEAPKAAQMYERALQTEPDLEGARARLNAIKGHTRTA